MNAEIITIGDEIVLGQIVDTNSAWIAQYLNHSNIAVHAVTSINDQKEAILYTLQQASSRSDMVIVTGGLGPTKDDITKTTISEFFNSPLIRNQQVLKHVKELFSRFSKSTEMPLSNYAQADILETAELLFNDVGTAPGMWIVRNGVSFAFLPGVPFEMKFLMQKRVFPKLNLMQGTDRIYHSHILTVGLGESFLAEQIADIEDELPAFIKLAYLPKLGLVRLRLTATGRDEKLIKSLTDKFSDRIAYKLAENVVAREDITLEEALIKEFSAKGLKLATAESCTGGLVASKITSYAGASSIFECGIVAYSEEVKMSVLDVRKDTLARYGVVSEEVVVEMVEGVKNRSGAAYGIATSGVAGPAGGSQDIPVGTVWIAVSGKNQKMVKKCSFQNNREINIERGAMQALILLWFLYKKEN